MGLVAVALRATRETAFRSGILAGVLVLLVALTGVWGLVLVPPVACWFVYLAVIVWRSGQRGKAVALLAVTALPVAYLVLYFANYHRPPDHPPKFRSIAPI